MPMYLIKIRCRRRYKWIEGEQFLIFKIYNRKTGNIFSHTYSYSFINYFYTLKIVNPVPRYRQRARDFFLWLFDRFSSTIPDRMVSVLREIFCYRPQICYSDPYQPNCNINNDDLIHRLHTPRKKNPGNFRKPVGKNLALFTKFRKY